MTVRELMIWLSHYPPDSIVEIDIEKDEKDGSWVSLADAIRYDGEIVTIQDGP